MIFSEKKHLKLILDKTKIQTDKECHYGITNFENLNKKTFVKYYNHKFSYNTKYVKKAVDSMLNISPNGVIIRIPKGTQMPLLICGLGKEKPVYLIAPTMLKGVKK